MKILELRFENLNSLYGEWFIDFTHPEYVGNGIFALTGPTGAGKSTILDAICLALYGCTPRLEKINKSTNEIMSRQTGECYAEVLFESKAGRFRCHWAQHRSRKKPDGALQSPTHEIAEGGEDGKVLENQLRSVADAVEEKTGMNFNRFTRSMLLAQGKFDTFLQAGIEDKSSILEQITGSKIYTEISLAVHARNREEEDKQKLLEAEVAGISILTPEEEAEIREQSKAKQKQETKLAGKVAETSKALTWLETVAALKAEIADLTTDAEALKVDQETFKPNLEKLKWALKAVDLDGEYARLLGTRKLQNDDQQALKTNEEALPALRKVAGEKVEALQTTSEDTAKAKKKQKEAAPTLQKVRSLDDKLADREVAIKTEREACDKASDEIKHLKTARDKKQGDLDTARKSLADIQKYLDEHLVDEWLVENLAGVGEQFRSLSGQRKKLSEAEGKKQIFQRKLAGMESKLATLAKQSNTAKNKHQKARERMVAEKKTLEDLLNGRLLREYRTEKDTLLRERALLAKIAAHEDERKQLEDGKACPLCGSEDHPYARGNVPVPDETDRKIANLDKRVAAIEKQQELIVTCEKAERVAEQAVTEAEKAERELAADKKNDESNLASLKDSLKSLTAEAEALQKALLIGLQPLGITAIPDGDIFQLQADLTARRTQWQQYVAKKTKKTGLLNELEGELKTRQAVIKTHSDALNQKQETLKKQQGNYDKLKAERAELFGNRNPDAEEAKLQQAITDAEKTEKAASEANNQARQALKNCQNTIATLRDKIKERGGDLKHLEDAFLVSLQQAGFADEDTFISARLEKEARRKLETQKQALKQREIQIQAKRTDRQERLTTESAKNVTTETPEALKERLEAEQKALKQLTEEIAGIKQKLDQNAKAKERIKDKQTAIDAQQKECLRWKRLHDLIGSNDGKKFRNFAQGLTFELMVSHANQQLRRMTDRYLLMRDENEPLSLNVIDNYQAGEIRTTKNLSGGEGFIVCLALALGLSKMASQKVRVDSLFLDEGFGTLDEEALETALEALSTLQQDGKLIGVISHVPALKERISTQIIVDKLSGGRSALDGPGVKKQ